MISLSLDHHDFFYAVEGFARGSHLRHASGGTSCIRASPRCLTTTLISSGISCDATSFLATSTNSTASDIRTSDTKISCTPSLHSTAAIVTMYDLLPRQTKRHTQPSVTASRINTAPSFSLQAKTDHSNPTMPTFRR